MASECHSLSIPHCVPEPQAQPLLAGEAADQERRVRDGRLRVPPGGQAALLLFAAEQDGGGEVPHERGNRRATAA